jgi:hypothetical protein
METWLEVPGHSGLRASSWGRVWLPDTKRLKTKPGYGQWDKIQKRFVVVIQRDKRCKTYRVARLVCLAFHGEPPEGKPYCLHLDEDGRNNRPDNLMWGSQRDNLNAAGFIAHCKARTGDDNPYVKGRRRC